MRGLSMANWRLVLNAVCLPVLAWGSQLWYLTGAAKMLIAMLQHVQNEMVKVVTGSFHTAPRGALLHITRMLPMVHYIEKLTLGITTGRQNPYGLRVWVCQVQVGVVIEPPA